MYGGPAVSGLGTTYCEKTCDDLVGGFCAEPCDCTMKRTDAIYE